MRNLPFFIASALLATTGACSGPKAEPAASPAAAESTASAAPAPTAAEAQKPSTNEDSLSSVFEISGVATAVRTSPLSPKAGGILASIRARPGTSVNAGQVLGVLDTTDLAIRADGAKIAYELAKTGVENAESDLTRAKELHRGGALTNQGIEKAELAVNIAKLQADAAKVQLRAAEQALYDASMRAPFAGVVTKVLSEEGQMITTMPPAVVFVLVDTSVLEVKVPIPERYLSQIKKDMPVHVALPSAGVEREGKVDRIPEVIDPVTRSVEAIIRLDNSDRALPAGLYARVRFPGVKTDVAEAVAKEMTNAEPEVKVQ